MATQRAGRQFQLGVRSWQASLSEF